MQPLCAGAGRARPCRGAGGRLPAEEWKEPAAAALTARLPGLSLESRAGGRCVCMEAFCRRTVGLRNGGSSRLGTGRLAGFDEPVRSSCISAFSKGSYERRSLSD